MVLDRVVVTFKYMTAVQLFALCILLVRTMPLFNLPSLSRLFQLIYVLCPQQWHSLYETEDCSLLKSQIQDAVAPPAAAGQPRKRCRRVIRTCLLQVFPLASFIDENLATPISLHGEVHDSSEC